MAIEKRVISYAVSSKNLLGKYLTKGYLTEPKALQILNPIHRNTIYCVNFNIYQIKSLWLYNGTTFKKLFTEGQRDNSTFMFDSKEYDYVVVWGQGAQAYIMEGNVFNMPSSTLDRLATTSYISVTPVTSPAYVPYGATIYKYVKRDHKPNPAWKGLPAGYKQLEYIESTGTQYIDTELIGSETTRIVIDCTKTNTVSTIVHIAGSITDKSSAISWNTGIGSTPIHRFGAKEYSGSFTDHTIRHILEIANSGYKIDGTTVWVPNASVFTTPDTLRLCGASGSGSNFVGIVYGVQFYDDVNLVRDFVPCINPNNQVGMYDLISQSFFPNAGTGTFIAGPQVPRAIDLGRKVQSYTPPETTN